MMTKPETTVPANAPSQEDKLVIERVQGHLAEGKPQSAIEAIRKAKNNSPWVANAMGVCLLRLGDVAGAVHAFRSLCVEPGGFGVRAEAPTVFKTNFATALLLSDNLAGCLSTLAEVRGDSHPEVPRLHETLKRWKASLSFWEKIQYYTGGQPGRKPEFETPPGSLE